MCLPALAVTVKPLAYVAANYTRSDRHKECYQEIHMFHPLPVASMGKGSALILPQFDNPHKAWVKRARTVLTVRAFFVPVTGLDYL